MDRRRLAAGIATCSALALFLTACAQQPPQATAPIAAPAPAVQAAPTPEQAVQQLFTDYWEEGLRLSPLSATYVGDARYNDQLPNFLSAEFRAQELEFNRKWRARIAAVDPAPLGAQDRLSLQILLRELDNEIEGARFPGWLQPINQFYSLPNQMAQLGSGSSAQPFKTVQDYDNWLKRAGQIPVLFDQAIANMREGVAAGVVQPRVLMDKVLPQLDALIVAEPQKALFFKPIDNLPAEFSAEDKARLTSAYTALIGDTLMPSYRKLRDYIRNDYLPKTRASVGLAALPDGAAWYAYRVRTTTTTDLTPAQIHQIGLDEVARIHGEMRKVIKQLKFKGDLKQFFHFLDTDKRFEFKSEEELLAYYNGLRGKVEAGSAKLFTLLPKAGFEIRPVESFRNKSAAGGSYQSPSEDGSRPGIFYVNTYDLPTRKIWDAEDLFLHEAIPGHHFQLALQQELTDLPKFRRFGGVTAYIEGWGLYAESLGREIGVYQDPYDYFGYLQNELWRAIRLVVDTGLHSKGWSRKQVIDYMLANSAQSETQAISEAERYMAIPGQALAYKLGELKIKELRARAERALGAKFDIREFHREVLKDGAVPLGVLDAKIDLWIGAQRG
ncbi:MAG: DUF885 domain-containing protein [Nevskiaceae bacterium]|nr:MAG: DUF885 domain-containing protein [Nevskiaceae bacterium]TAM25944.1 MAG: DUF885 domain-containing protein [Nevskiaceae bacterium]